MDTCSVFFVNNIPQRALKPRHSLDFPLTSRSHLTASFSFFYNGLNLGHYAERLKKIRMLCYQLCNRSNYYKHRNNFKIYMCTVFHLGVSQAGMFRLALFTCWLSKPLAKAISQLQFWDTGFLRSTWKNIFQEWHCWLILIDLSTLSQGFPRNSVTTSSESFKRHFKALMTLLQSSYQLWNSSHFILEIYNSQWMSIFGLCRGWQHTAFLNYDPEKCL